LLPAERIPDLATLRREWNDLEAKGQGTDIIRAMPLFEFECRDCGRRFEAFVTADRKPACPACQGAELRKLVSSPGMVGSLRQGYGEPAAEAIPACRAQGGHCACSHTDN